MDYASLKDTELLELFKTGDGSAFNELFERYKEKIVHVCARITHDFQAAEDIAHEAFLELHQNPGRFKGDSGFYSYFCGIAINKSKMHVRSKVRKRELSLSVGNEETETDWVETFKSDAASASETQDKKDLAALLQKALDRLPETAKHVFVLSEVEELSYEEIAKALGTTKTNVGWHLHEARKRLRKLLPLELLEIFLFRIPSLPQEVFFTMNLLGENLKLLFGLPSFVLLSFYMDGETTRWQNRRIESLIETHARFGKEYQANQKIKFLYHQIERPKLAEDFNIRFERKLAGLSVPDRNAGFWVSEILNVLNTFRLRVAAPILTVLIAGFSFLIYPVLMGQPLEVARFEGAAFLFDSSSQAWNPLPAETKIKKGMRVKTEQGSVDFELPGKVLFRLKENTEVTFQSVFRSRQSGQIKVSQTRGKSLVGLNKKFKGSRFSLETPYGSAHAYGTLFLAEIVHPSPVGTRILVLEGIVEVEDAQKQTIKIVAPETERFITPREILEAKPLREEQRSETEELLNLPVPGGLLRTTGILEENIVLRLIPGPGRVREYLNNPRVYANREFPILTPKILEARKKMVEADQKDNPDLYEEAIRDLQNFSLQYLDPYGRFKPQIDFFAAAYYHFQGRFEESLQILNRVAEFPSETWKAMAYLGRGIIYEEKLKQTENAQAEYRKVLAASPNSPEATEARNRLAKP